MTTVVTFSIVFYSIVLAFCVLAAIAMPLSYGKDGTMDGMYLLTVILVCLCGVLISVVYIHDGRPLSGDYALHLSFAMSPLFLRRVFGVGRQELVVPLVVSAAVIVSFFFSFMGVVSWYAVSWLPLLMVAFLILLVGRAVWERTDYAGKFDPVAVAREWLSSLADIFYYSILVLLAFCGFSAVWGGMWCVAIEACLCVSLLIGLFVAMLLRWRKGRTFLLLHMREEAYLGGLGRSSKVALALNEECGLSGEELFEHLKEHFEKKMPYLDPELTLNDVAKSLLTNKVYLSRAINEFTGQNFCQFVNFYRIKYAMRLFIGNNSYKISDLAFRSGFHTERSFAMAFRLYMNIPPSQWCKQNKGKTIDQALRN